MEPLTSPRPSLLAAARRNAARFALAGVIILIGLFLAAPIVVVMVTAFNPARYLVFPPQGFTLTWFGEILDNRDIIAAFHLSLQVAAMAAVISTAVGTLAALVLTRSKLPGLEVVRLFMLSPLIVPGVVFGIALLIFLNDYGLIGTPSAILAAHVCLTLPYVVRTVSAGLESLDRAIEESALSLGASPAIVILTVTLPSIRSSLFAGAVFAFLISFDEAVVTLFISGVDAVTLPVFIFQYVQYNNDPLVAAIATVMVLITSSAVILSVRKIRLI